MHFSAFSTAENTKEFAKDVLIAEKKRLEGLIIGIDPGHQEHENSEEETISPKSKEKKAKVSSGTCGVFTNVAEYIVNLDVAIKLRNVLESLGAKVVMTRETHDVNISNRERAVVMNNANVDLALRIHCNGTNSHLVCGIGGYVRKTGTRQEECEAAAKVIVDEMCNATGAKKDGVYLSDTYTMNNWCVVPCVTIEMGFMTNCEEDKKLNDPAYQNLLAEGMVNGICKFFKR